MTPFSGDNYEKNAKRCKAGVKPCAHCGKPTPNPTFCVRIYEGGQKYAMSEAEFAADADSLPGDMYAFPVGTECASRLVKAGVYVGR